LLLQVPAVNVPTVSTNDILKDTFGVAPITVNGSGLDDAQAASDNAGGSSQQVMCPAMLGMQFAAHSAGDSMLLYLDPGLQEVDAGTAGTWRHDTSLTHWPCKY
jgi:hypothetical protein